MYSKLFDIYNVVMWQCRVGGTRKWIIWFDNVFFLQK